MAGLSIIIFVIQHLLQFCSRVDLGVEVICLFQWALLMDALGDAVSVSMRAYHATAPELGGAPELPKSLAHAPR